MNEFDGILMAGRHRKAVRDEAPVKDERHHYRATVPSDLGRLSEVRRFVERVTKSSGVDRNRAFDLKVATSEAAANAIEHSGREGEQIRLAADVDPQSVTVEVVSDGDFVLLAQPPERARTRGMGLPLMAALTDELTLRRRRDGGFCVGLTIFRDAPR